MRNCRQESDFYLILDPRIKLIWFDKSGAWTIYSITAADLTTQGARASVAIVLTELLDGKYYYHWIYIINIEYISLNILVSATDGLTCFFFYFNNNTCTWIYKNAQTTNNNDKCKQYDMFCLTHKIIMQYVMSNNVINLKQFFDLHFLWFPITHALYCQVVWIWTNDWNMLKSLYTP